MKALFLSLVLVVPLLLRAQLPVPQPRTGNNSYLGVSLTDIDADKAKALKLDAERGAEVVRVTEDGPADKAGLKTGDVLLSYNGETVLGAQQLGRLVWETPPGRHVKVQFWRDGKTNAAVVITAMAPARIQPRLIHESWRPEFMSGLIDIPVPVLAWKNLALGIECEPMSEQLGTYFGVRQGILVRSVDPEGLAEKAGIKPGDVLTAVDDRTVSEPRDLTGCLRAPSTAGKPVTITLIRSHKHLSLPVTLPPE